jgi:putative ABC transport system ATP-binding protein
LEYFGVGEQKNKIPTELSGGQQQRVAISRALVNDPQIILADEPVGNLDSKSAQNVLGLIQEMNIKNKKTVILVTHDPSHLDIADKIVFIKDGRIINVKVNEEIRKIVPSGTQPSEAQKSNLELVAKTVSRSSGSGLDGLMLDLKAKEVVAETLTGLSSEELSGIENYVKDILRDKAHSAKQLEKYLDKDVTHGGLALDLRVARRLAKKMKETADEIRKVAISEKKYQYSPSRVKQLCAYLLDTFDISLCDLEAVEAMEKIITDWDSGAINSKILRQRLGDAVKNGGVGLRGRLAKNVAKHLELMISQKPNLSMPKESKEKEINKT